MRVKRPEHFRIYEPDGSGMSKVYYFDANENPTLVFETQSVRESKQQLDLYKRKNNLMQTRVEFPSGLYSETGATPNKVTFPVNKRFEMAEHIVKMVANGDITSVVLCGQGGVGKSFTVVNYLKQNNIRYKINRGAISPMELFKYLQDHKNDLIVFDDCDSVFQTESSTNILKAVLDTTGERTVSWYSGALDESYDPEFTFAGRIIFISNRLIERIPDPILSRAMCLDLSFTRDELVERMRELAPVICPKLTADQQLELIDHIAEYAHMFKNLSLRTLAKAYKILLSGAPNWKEMVLFAG
jgi:hypothetical protein